MNNYAFGAGGFKLGDRVEIMTTKQRGILISEVVHISGCNTYEVLLPNVIKDDAMKVKNCDYLILRKLEDNEAVFGKEDNSTDDTVFAPKGTDVNAEWILDAAKANKEAIPELDEAIGVEEIKIQPGTEVWHKLYNLPMIVNYIWRKAYTKELDYGLTYMSKDKEITVSAPEYAMIPMEVKINIFPNGKTDKTGPVFDDCHAELNHGFSIDDFNRFGGM